MGNKFFAGNDEKLDAFMREAEFMAQERLESALMDMAKQKPLETLDDVMHVGMALADILMCLPEEREREIRERKLEQPVAVAHLFKEES